MMKNILLIAMMGICFGCSNNQTSDNGETPGSVGEGSTPLAGVSTVAGLNENAEGWETLFDGENTDKWVGINRDQFPEEGWAVDNGTLFLAGAGGGNIITREKYGDFDLVFEFNYTPGANSGVKYFVTDLKNKKSGKFGMNGPEYQIIDDENNADIKDRTDETSTTAALYLLYSPANKKLLPAGQWNQGRIVSKDRQVEHWLNGVKVLSYERGSSEFRERVEGTKFNTYEAYGEAPSGHILLTDHNDKVYFRNIKVKRL